MADLTEVEAYKQLLEVTENIIASLTTEQEIVRKYQTLKKSILAKVYASPGTASQQPFHGKIAAAYKEVTQQLLQGLGHFQAEIEGEMNRSSFLKNSKKVIQSINKQSKLLSEDLQRIGDSSKNLKLLLKEESNGYKYLAKQIEGKIENMGLMIEVHRKMHEIIMQASDKEAKRGQKEQEYEHRVAHMESLLDQIEDVDKFMDAYQITQKKANKFQMARKGLARVLFDL